MKRILFLISLLSMDATICNTAHILAIFPLPFEDNQLLYRTYVNGLAKNGHDIVVMTTNPMNNKDKILDNIKEISVEHMSHKFWNEFVKKSCSNLYCRTKKIKEAMLELIDLQFSTSRMKSILRNEQLQFDLVIVESILPALYSIGYKFGAPVIGITLQNSYVGKIDVQKYPLKTVLYNDFIMSQDARKTFFQKLETLCINILNIFFNSMIHERSHNVMRNHLDLFLPIGVEDKRQRTSLSLSFGESSSSMKALPPATIPVGSFRFNVTQNLSEELKHFMDHSKLGFIYVNMEFREKVHNIQPEAMRMLLRVFNEIRYNVLLMWPNDTLPGRPDNVFISKSFPQHAILRHSNIRAFIMQCRTKFLDESIFYKVPVILFSISEEREEEIIQNVNKWMIGEAVDIKNTSKQHLKRTILNVASNLKYNTNIKKISQMLHDAPHSGLERAIWWTEYVLRHNGVGHLMSPTLSHYEYLMLDVIAFIFLSIVIVSSFTIWTVLHLFPRIAA